MCLVNTDVEGSTELWEWNREVMDLATKVHDRVMRSKLTAFHGYEVSTEGDSFMIAFHEPADAVAWAVTLQQVHLADQCLCPPPSHANFSFAYCFW